MRRQVAHASTLLDNGTISESNTEEPDSDGGRSRRRRGARGAHGAGAGVVAVVAAMRAPSSHGE